jgi:hypothetical protein
MLDYLKKEFNKTQTTNGDKAFKSTNSKVLDFFSSAGAMRNSSEDEIIRNFVFAFNEDENLAMKCLFYFRDIKSGQGERRLFRTIINYLADNHPEKIKQLIKLIPEYGRWDDLLILFNTKVENEVINIIKYQLYNDLESDTPSLLSKWLPTSNTSCKITRRHAKYLIKKLDITEKHYRKTLSTLRNKIKLLERTMSSKEWKSIEYDKIPSKAGMIYRSAFHKHDEERYASFLESVKKGEKKINSSTLYPYEIYDKVRVSSKNDITLDEMWKALPNYVNKEENALVMADVSCSMMGRPMSVSVSLALYFAERNKGKFANHFMTFTTQPDLVEIQGKNVFEKMNFIEKSKWEGSTNISLAFDKILSIAKENNVPQKELPKRLYVISDMQFDGCISGSNTSAFERAKKSFNDSGYELPEVVFWNVSDNRTKPVTTNDLGVQLASGCSPVLFKQIVSGLSAYDLMLKILNSDRYKNIC